METGILSLVQVSIYFLNKAFCTEIALVRFELKMKSDMVSHIAKLEDFLVTQSTDQNLILSTSVRVCKGVPVIVSFYVDFLALF